MSPKEETQKFNSEKSPERKIQEMSTPSSLSGYTNNETQQVDESQVIEIFKADKGDAPEVMALSGDGRTYRHDWGNRNGQWILNLNWGFINANSRVFVAIGEGAPGGGKFIGSARYTLHNVAPANGRVSIWVNIEWSYPIRLYVDYLVVNP
jgi:hypothetical protein